ncbi:class I SAM-dependent methyltransferase [Crocosphaera sp. Alani8]|uniref:class I SAM-dependent methyltransferase n=1 Tax=Crocosphaera sp. Alani8 TaxID=3038952 RepID=UPI00313DBCAA
MTKFSPESSAVQQLYNTYPFPPEPLLNEPPPGYNWRWNWIAAYNFCTGRKPVTENIRILDAGCGTGVGTEYLILLNPHAEIVGVDISEKALEIAQKRCEQSGVATNHNHPISFHHLPLENADEIQGEFDLINCVGVLHHLPDPIAGIKALSKKLAPGGIFHIFVYAELGRWEIQLMQKAISLLQAETKGDYKDGVFVGRKLFETLPENNRIVKQEERWSLENHRDESFADMYVHPQETDYNIDTLFELIEASGLEFIGFSNPQYWQLDRLIGESEELIKRGEKLSDRQRYRLIELLDPENITHYEFFLGKPPILKIDWSEDETLLSAICGIHPCLHGWPSQSLLNYDYQPVSLNDAEYNFMQNCDQKLTVKEILAKVSVDLEIVRSLQKKQLIILTPNNS